MKRYFPESPRFGSKEIEEQGNLEPLEADPGRRKQINEFHPNLQDEVRKAYLIKGPNTCRGHKYPK